MFSKWSFRVRPEASRITISAAALGVKKVG